MSRKRRFRLTITIPIDSWETDVSIIVFERMTAWARRVRLGLAEQFGVAPHEIAVEVTADD